MLLILLLLAAALLLLNAFFVLAEFAVVKMRPSRVQELADAGNASARIVRHIQSHLNEYLNVCQIGITLASIGLGFVGEPAIARLVQPLFAWAGAASEAAAHGVAIAVAYTLVSMLHIVLGEMVPKTLAIVRTERMALVTAAPLRFFRILFYVPLVVLNGSANLIVRLMGLGTSVAPEAHSETELRILLAQSQSTGLLSLRRLLLMENVFDLGGLKVRDAMKPRAAVRVLRADASWEENLAVIRESRFSRYPLLEEGLERPLGIVHVKDLLLAAGGAGGPPSLTEVARPYWTATEDSLLEDLLAELQRRRVHLAVVTNAQGQWTGFLSLEDIIEEILGAVEDEFEAEPAVHLGDLLNPRRLVLGVQAASLPEAIGRILDRVPPGELPVAPDAVRRAVLEREEAMSTYLGRGVAVPHARLEGLDRPVAIVGRSEDGIPVAGTGERAHLLFVLLSPLNAPAVQVRLLTRIAGILDSETVAARLRDAPTPEAVIEAIRAGEQAVLG
jgi:CBS domain containing-hemolysin-like protein/mannitol/fructose-specific phosphotransferase system IIA component (Ntr-type)